MTRKRDRFMSFVKGVSSPVLSIIDKAVIDRDQRDQLKNDVEMALMAQLEFFEEEISNRHALDMQSDSWLSKNIRPLSLVFLMVMFVIISVFDGNIGSFSVGEDYIPVYQTLLSLIFTFYFGSRGAEKITKIYKSKEQ